MSLDGVADGNRIYFISDGVFVKVGQTISVYTRLRAIRRYVRQGLQDDLLHPTEADWEVLEVVASAPAPYSLERHVLARLNRWRVIGEWFHDCAEFREEAAGLLPGRLVLADAA